MELVRGGCRDEWPSCIPAAQELALEEGRFPFALSYGLSIALCILCKED